VLRIVENPQARRLPPGLNLIDGRPRRRRLVPESPPRGDCKKLNQRVITDGPRRWPLGQPPDQQLGPIVQARVAAVGVNENVGVDGDHRWKSRSRWQSIAWLIASSGTTMAGSPAAASRSRNGAARSRRLCSRASRTIRRRLVFRRAAARFARSMRPSGISMVVRMHKYITLALTAGNGDIIACYATSYGSRRRSSTRGISHARLARLDPLAGRQFCPFRPRPRKHHWDALP